MDQLRLFRNHCYLSSEGINLLGNRSCQGFALALVHLGQSFDLVLVHPGQGFNLFLVYLFLIFHCFHEQLDKVRQGHDLCTGVCSLLL